jgi:drug/metabolite transporter (DMT)-like permease
VADLALVLLTLVWGTTFTLVKRVLDAGTSLGVFLSLRFGLALVAAMALWAWRRPKVTPGLLRDGVRLGLAMFGGFALQTAGLAHTTPARAGFITGLAVVLVPFVARFAMGRRVQAASWVGVVLAVVGLALLIRPFGAGGSYWLGDLLTLGCAVSYSFQIIWTSEFSPRHPLLSLVTVQIAVTFLGSLLLLPVGGTALHSTPELWGIVAFTGLAMTVGAFFVMNWAQRHTTAVRAALIYTLEPPAAAAFSHLVTGERFDALGLAGAALILGGVVVAEVGGALAARRSAA